MYLKINLFILFIFLLISYSYTNIQFNQPLFVKNVSKRLKLIKIEFNKINEEIQQKTNFEKQFKNLNKEKKMNESGTEVSKNENKKTLKNTLEIYLEYKTDSEDHEFFLAPSEIGCSLNKNQSINKYYKVKQEGLSTVPIQKIEIKEEFKIVYREGILICDVEDYYDIMEIKPIFLNLIYFQPFYKEKENEKYKIAKFEWNLIKKELYIKICINFKEKGNYLIILKNFYSNISIKFYLQTEEGENCVNEIFIFNSEEEINNLNYFKNNITIRIIKTDEGEEYKNGIFINDIGLPLKYLIQTYNLFIIYPLIDDGIYEFNEEKLVKNEFKNKIKKNNILKNNLIPREIGEKSKNKIFKNYWQKLFLFKDEYFMMKENGKAVKILNENEEEE